MKTTATCYELREVWGFGCPNPVGCPNGTQPAQPKPCAHGASVATYARERPLPPDGAPIKSPCGHEERP